MTSAIVGIRLRAVTSATPVRERFEVLPHVDDHNVQCV
jgi:hypothetical protein